MSDEKLSSQLVIRVTSMEKELFAAKCKTYGRNPSDVLREVMAAIVNDGFKIKIDPKDKALYE